MSYKEFVNDIKQGLAPVYLITGEEDFLKSKAIQYFKKVIPEELRDINLAILNGNTVAADHIVMEAKSVPFGGGRKVVIVNNFTVKAKDDENKGQEKKGKKKSDPLLEYIENPCESTVLVLIADKINKNTKLYKAIPKKFEFGNPKRGELASILRDCAKARGKEFEPDALELFSSCGDNLYFFINELEKLVSYIGSRPKITEEDVKALVPNPTATIFEVVDNIGHKNYSAALKGINDLLAMKEPGPRILAMIARQFNLILKAKESKNAQDFANKAGLRLFIANKVFSQSANYSKEQVIENISRLVQVDRSIKLGEEFYPAMQKFMLSL